MDKEAKAVLFGCRSKAPGRHIDFVKKEQATLRSDLLSSILVYYVAVCTDMLYKNNNSSYSVQIENCFCDDSTAFLTNYLIIHLTIIQSKERFPICCNYRVAL